MKKAFLTLLLLFVASCASKSKLPEEKGTLCIPRQAGQELSECYPVRLYTDPTRFHYLRPWQERSLGEMPSLP